jgi:hypothetical protein
LQSKEPKGITALLAICEPQHDVIPAHYPYRPPVLRTHEPIVPSVQLCPATSCPRSSPFLRAIYVAPPSFHRTLCRHHHLAPSPAGCS